jgi:carbon-monoxide dehydrogenase large subunit
MAVTELVNQSSRESFAILGKSVLRKEDWRLITGNDTYVANIHRPNMLHMAILRSPYAHAKIKSIDVTKALKDEKVVCIMSGDDVKQFPCFWYSQPEGMKQATCYPLALNIVVFVGEPVVAVVATTEVSAKDALDDIQVEYEELEPVVNAEEGLSQKAPIIYEEWGDNIAMRYETKGGDVERVFNEADYVFSEKLDIHRYSATPMETRAYVADYDTSSDFITLWATTQNPHLLRTILSVTLKHPESKIRVIEPDVGGAFGGKMPSYPEEFLVCILAKKLARSVKYVEERSESLVSMHQARQQTHDLQVAVTKTGRVLGIKDKVTGDLGASFPTTGPASLATATRFIPSCYNIKGYQAKVTGVATNKPPYGAYRGFGKDAANFVIERLMNLVATRLKIDPVKLRLDNFIPSNEFPFRTITGAYYDSGDYASCLKRACEVIGYENFREKQIELRRQSRYVGIGFSVVLEPSASHFPGSMMMGYETATVKIDPTGNVTVLSGMTSTGTSHETVLAQIASEVLTVNYRDIVVLEGDTIVGPYGFGNWASRSVVLGANAVYLASAKLRDKILQIGSFLTGIQKNDLFLQDGLITSKKDGGKKLALKDVAHASYFMNSAIPAGIEPGLNVTSSFFPSTLESKPRADGNRNAYAAFGYSVNSAIVEVDIETGKIAILKYIVCADPGRILHPDIVSGQIVGGVIQGLGGVILEEHVYDDRGQPLATTFMDYLLPTALDSPHIEVEHSETPSPFLPLGAKGAGEGGAEGVAATIINAVEDALQPFEVRIRDLPIKPERIWKALVSSKKREV